MDKVTSLQTLVLVSSLLRLEVKSIPVTVMHLSLQVGMQARGGVGSVWDDPPGRLLTMGSGSWVETFDFHQKRLGEIIQMQLPSMENAKFTAR